MPDANQLHATDVPKEHIPLSSREPLLDSCQAAAMLKIHPRTLQRMVHRGKIHAIQVGKLWRFKASSIEAWINRCA